MNTYIVKLAVLQHIEYVVQANNEESAAIKADEKYMRGEDGEPCLPLRWREEDTIHII